MSERLQAMIELERRGKLPLQFQAALAEARKRGLVPSGAVEQPAQERTNEQLVSDSVMAALAGRDHNRAQLFGDDDPTTQNAGERIGAFLNKAGEAATLGLIGDEASAAVESLVPGVNYDDRLQHYRQQEAVLERDSPGLALGAEAGGAVLGALAPGGAIGTLGRGAGLLPRIGASAAAGAGMGATYGFMEGEGAQDRAQQAGTGAKWGAAVGAAIPAGGAVVQKVADNVVGNRAVRQAAANAPTTDQMRQQGQAAYQAVDDAGVQIKPDAMNRLVQQLNGGAVANGMDVLPGPGSLTPQSARVNQIAKEMAEQLSATPAQNPALPFSSLDQLRRHAGTAAGNMANKTDSRVGTGMIGDIDDFVAALGPNDLAAGDAQQLQSAIGKARDVWARMSRSQTVDDAIEASGDYLSGGASGIRNQFRRILRSDKLRRGFSDAEIKQMRRVVNGSIPETLLHYAGSGLGMMGTTGLGAAAGSVAGPLGGAAGGIAGAALGGASRRASEAVARKNAEVVRAIVANGGLRELPQASPAARQIIEELLRRGTAATAQ